MCDHILMIEEGKMVFSGTVDEFDNYILPSTLFVSFIDSPGEEVLRGIEGILGVEEIGNNKYRVRFTDAQDVMDRIVEASVRGEWHLSEIRVEKSSLDSIFAELSRKTR